MLFTEKARHVIGYLQHRTGGLPSSRLAQLLYVAEGLSLLKTADRFIGLNPCDYPKLPKSLHSFLEQPVSSKLASPDDFDALSEWDIRLLDFILTAKNSDFPKFPPVDLLSDWLLTNGKNSDEIQATLQNLTETDDLHKVIAPLCIGDNHFSYGG